MPEPFVYVSSEYDEEIPCSYYFFNCIDIYSISINMSLSMQKNTQVIQVNNLK